MAYNGKEIQEHLNKHGYNLNVDGIVGPKTTAAIKDFQTKNGLKVDGIVGTQTWGALTNTQNTTPTAPAPAQTAPQEPTFNYQKSDEAKQKDALVQQINASRPGDFSYSQQTLWDDIMNQIQNGEKFSYDLNGDMLYQQYKDQYTTQGKLAMMDTMGQAAAMTGGYGNSYAQSVGQQAYQGYLQGLNDKIPELYQLALDKYNQDRQDLYNQYALHSDKFAQEYGLHRDNVTDWENERNYLTDDARYTSETEYGQAMDKYNIDYTSFWNNKNFDYQKEQDQKVFDEGIRQFDVTHGLATAKAGLVSGGNGSYYTANPGWDIEKVKAFQEAHNLEVDGIWGPKTAAAYDKDPDWTYEGKKWTDYDEETHNRNVKENGGSYYQQVLNDLKEMKKKGKTNAEVSAFLQETLGNSYISQSEYKTLYNKYRDNKL